MNKNPGDFEDLYVHKFYSDHSTAFSSTRYAPWPGIKKFLENIDPTSSLVLDSGCGNGRNMSKGMFGCDFSHNLLKDAMKINFKGNTEDDFSITKQINSSYEPMVESKKYVNSDIPLNNQNLHEEKNKSSSFINEDNLIKNENYKHKTERIVNNTNLARCTIINHPYKNETFDYILSIAVIHHLSTKERRLEALHDLKRILKPKGLILLYVWSKHVNNQKKFIQIPSLEDEKNESKNSGKLESSDYKVVWGKDKDKIRYYFLYDMDELRSDCSKAGFKIREMKIEQESIYAILEK